MTAPLLATIVGAPRSGTTWIQQLLCAHPAVASPQETHLFQDYLAPLYRSWDRQSDGVRSVVAAAQADLPPPRRLIGLPTIVEAADFDRLAHAFLDAVVAQSLASKPGAHVVLEKSPSNSLHVDLVRRLVPEIRFIHVIRDPRDTVRSLLDAGAQEWGGDWAPRTAAHAARIWDRHYSGALAASGAAHYLEVRYEAMRSRPQEELTRILQYLGVEADAARVESCIAQAQTATAEGYALAPGVADALGGRTVREPVGFVRDARRAAPRRLSAEDRLVVADVLGDRLAELGYGGGPDWVRVGPVSRARLMAKQRAGDVARRGRSRLASRLTSGPRGVARPPAEQSAGSPQHRGG